MSVAALDLGGTSIKGGLFDAGRLVKEIQVPTDKTNGRESIFASLYEAFKQLDDGHVSCVGLSSAGTLDIEKGTCVYATDNLPGWTGCPIVETLQKKWGVPVYLDNDAICALEGELLLHPDAKNVTMLTFGTGVGGASLIDGKIDRRPLTAWGHFTLVEGGLLCNCGKKGCAEAYLSAHHFGNAARDLGYGGTISLVKAAEHHDMVALDYLDEYGGYLGEFLCKIESTVPVDLFLLGGGLMNSFKTIYPSIDPLPKAKVEQAALGNKAGIYGAFKLTLGH